MASERPDVQRLDGRSAICAVAAVVLISVHELLWRFARETLATPLWEGANLTFTFVLSASVIFIPIFLAWLVVRKDSGPVSTHESSDHSGTL
jgi:hypothetical protein